MWTAGDREQEGKGTGSPPLQWQQTITSAKATCELSFSLFTAIRSWQIFPAAHPWELMLSRHLTEVKHSDRPPNKIWSFFQRHLLSPSGTNSTEVCFCCILIKTLFFAFNTLLSLYASNRQLVWMVPPSALQWDLKAKGYRPPNPETELHTRHFSKQLKFISLCTVLSSWFLGFFKKVRSLQILFETII